MKTITINLYSPKELWRKFWNRVFWPRRKACAEWMEIGEVWMEHAIISEVICKADYLDFDTANKLELEIKPKMHEVFQKLETAIKIPCDPIHDEKDNV